ncbi:hypothetical protein LINGRAHAP2_LOCUS20873 [Linum grandiflorum]
MMMGVSLNSCVRFLLLLLTLFFLLATPTFQHSLPLQGGKLSLPSIKTGSISSVNRRGGGGGSRGGGARGGGSHGGHGSGKGGGGTKGEGISGRGRAIPVYAGGAAAAAASRGHHHNGAVLINPGKTNLGLSVLVLAITLFKHFFAC